MKTLKTIWEALVRFFTDTPKALIDNVAEISVMRHTKTGQYKETTKNRQKTSPPKEITSMGMLLENLDETFATLRLPHDKFSWIPRERFLGLRKMGVHVVNLAGSSNHYDTDSTVQANRILPSMICVSFGASKYDNDNVMYPAIIFAIKENRLPAYVSKCSGQHYLFGMGFKMFVDSTNKRKKELFWIGGYMTVCPDGSLHLHQEIKSRQHTIKTSNAVSRRASGKTITYTTKSWSKSSLAIDYDTDHPGKGESICKREFADAMNWWIARENNWSVAVKKNGERVTFAIPKNLTSQFFKDRIKVTNENGKTRPIIHYVNSHERVKGEAKTIVREHIRGLSEFDWKGYDCRVTAPKFNGVLSSGFVLDGIVFEDGENMPKKGFIDESKLGALLAEAEDGKYFDNKKSA